MLLARRPFQTRVLRCTLCALLPLILLIIAAVCAQLLVPDQVEASCGSPLRRSKIRELVVDVARCLDRCGLTYFLASGTLLGSLRDRDIIEHDYDADLGVLCRNHTKLLSGRACAPALQTRIVARSVTVQSAQPAVDTDETGAASLLDDVIPCENGDVFLPFIDSALAHCLRDSNLGVRLLPRIHGMIKLWRRLPGENFGDDDADTGSPHLDIQLFDAIWARDDSSGNNSAFLQWHVGHVDSAISAMAKKRRRRRFQASMPPRCASGDAVISNYTGFCIPRLAAEHVVGDYGANWRMHIAFNPACWLAHAGWFGAAGYLVWIVLAIRVFHIPVFQQLRLRLVLNRFRVRTS